MCRPHLLSFLACGLLACSTSSSDPGEPGADTGLAGDVGVTDTDRGDSATSDSFSPDASPDVVGLDSADSGGGDAGPGCLAVGSDIPGGPSTTAWANHVGSPTSSTETRVFDVSVDKTGNLYVTGNFSGTVNLGGANLVAKGSADLYIAKYDRDGKHLFSKSFGGAGASLTPRNIVVDESGGLYVGGLISGSASVGGATLSSVDGADALLARYSTIDGAHVWSKSFGGPLADSITALGVNAKGEVVAVARFETSIDVGGGTFSSSGSFDFALAAFSVSTGAHVWSKHFGTAATEVVEELALDGAGNIFLAGLFSGSTTNVGGPTLTTSAKSNSAFLARYDATGNHVWSRAPTGSDGGFYQELALAPDGSLVVAGRFQGPALDVGGCPMVVAGGLDVVLAKFDADGKPKWARLLGGKTDEIDHALAVDASGTITLAGAFFGSASFGGATFVSASTSAGSEFMASYGPDGGHVRSTAFVLTKPNELRIDAFATPIGGGTLVAGDFQGTIRVGSMDLTSPGTPTSSGAHSVFLAQLSP